MGAFLIRKHDEFGLGFTIIKSAHDNARVHT